MEFCFPHPHRKDETMTHKHQHSHGTDNVSNNVLLWSIIINLGLSVFEFIAGAISGSVALMADALHNTNDAAALLIAYIARKISKKAADEAYTFGYRRAELIGAMIQLTALMVVGLYLVYEAIARFLHPQALEGGWIMAAAGIALLVDAVTAWLLWAMSQGSVNVKAAFLHNLSDAGASLAVLIGGAAILWLDWTWVDPILTLIISGYILFMSFGMLKKTSRILMEGTPPELSLDEVVTAMTNLEGVFQIHHLHIWELDEHHKALEGHVVLSHMDCEHAKLRNQIKEVLNEQFSISHSTLEFEGPDEAHACQEQDLIPKH